MAAAGDAITTLRDAHALVAKAHGTELAKQLLVGWLGEGRVRWDGELVQRATGRQKELDLLFSHGELRPPYLYGTVYSPGDARFWQQDLEINWQESWAQARYLDRDTGLYVLLGPLAHRISLVREDVRALVSEAVPMPGEPSEPEVGIAHRRAAAPGRKPKFDWDALHAECLRRIDDNGRPINISGFTEELLVWCQNQFGEDYTPDLETARKYVARWIEGWDRSLPKN